MKMLKQNYQTQNTKPTIELANQVNPIFQPLINPSLKDFSDIVTIENAEEIPYYASILGDEFHYSSQFHNENIRKIDWTNEREKLYEVFNRIPAINKHIGKLDLALGKDSQLPEKIDKELVHKLDVDNVIISKAQKFGNMWYFNMFNKIKEFNFDHESDHVQGTLLMEAARQTGIASIHLNGLAVNGRLNMTCMNIKFNNYVEYGSPIIIRSMTSPIIFDKDQYAKNYAVVNLIQFGKICTTVYFEGVIFKDKLILNEYRNRSIKINERVKTKYLGLLNEIYA